MVPDEPYRAKGLCRGRNFPLTPCTFVVVPPLLILSTPVCIDVLEWSSHLNLALVSKTKEGTFEEKLRADLPILGFIVPEV